MMLFERLRERQRDKRFDALLRAALRNDTAGTEDSFDPVASWLKFRDGRLTDAIAEETEFQPLTPDAVGHTRRFGSSKFSGSLALAADQEAAQGVRAELTVNQETITAITADRAEELLSLMADNREIVGLLVMNALDQVLFGV